MIGTGAASRRGRVLTTGLIGGMVAAIAIMGWFAHRATTEWRRASEQLAQNRVERTADLLLNGINRDMRAAELTVLRRLHWAELAYDQPDALSGLVATAFALYPYPEVFFSWRRDTPDMATFFVRADRPPAWLDIDEGPRFYPVTVRSLVANEFPDRFRSGARQGRQLAAFPIERHGEHYQVVARLLYRTERRDVLESAVGFLVSERWARAVYFPQLLDQMGRVVGGGQDLTMAMLDEQGRLVAGESRGRGPVTTRLVRPIFFDPLLVPTGGSDLRAPSWRIEVSTADDPSLVFAVRVARWVVPVTAAATFALGLGLILTSRAIRASADLAEVRSEFVSSVTHGLKTPLATIRGVAEALLGGRLSSVKETREYAQILDQEAKRLARLVDNLLSYSRVTEASELYSFEPLAPADLIESALRGFESQFAQLGSDPHVDIPADLPPVRADRTTVILSLENLIDNALRYSGTEPWLGVRAWRAGSLVYIAIADNGIGIPPDEIDHVVQRYVRGWRAATGGSGLGLAIVNRVVTDHHGSLEISSRIGSGTEVRFSLPVAQTVS